MLKLLRRYLALEVFVVLVVGGGLLLGLLSAPDGWYAALRKPPFNPPNWVFAPVWTALYVMIAVAGWRTYERDAAGRAMALWCAQLALNFAWTPVFFGLHRPGSALIVIVALLVTIAVFIAERWRNDRNAALLFVPYLGWVAFATALNASIWWLN